MAKKRKASDAETARLGAGLERERPDALPIAASVRRTNGSSPPIDCTRQRQRTSDAREHATTSLVFGGWRRDDHKDDNREEDDRKDDDREDDDRDKQRSRQATIARAAIARAMIARATIARATIARVTAATSNGHADRNERDHGDRKGDKKSTS